ncbi:hypothetical protein OKW98_15945 [Pseudomonas sp. KU26590]|uniref:hypothetical protein n=1 Tax=Pseudomonas sp. KU26590 TaxID=2991051 RepID=UPI00223E79F9|nr:hypothetical protein [Pseudomonas sp. KU26590]UZJ58101.1 hypothetical protein OKW98_15945 [Pseudomonas sp. KU26590]
MNKLLEDSTLNEAGELFNDTAQPDFTSCLTRFEAEAATLGRGFRTALFVQQFKAGLLPKSVRGVESLH